jgi:hypothetical protein
MTFEAADVYLDNGATILFGGGGFRQKPPKNMPVRIDCYCLGDTQIFKWDGEWQFNMTDCLEIFQADSTWSLHRSP